MIALIQNFEEVKIQMFKNVVLVSTLNCFQMVHDSITERFLCTPGPMTDLIKRFFFLYQ